MARDGIWVPHGVCELAFVSSNLLHLLSKANFVSRTIQLYLEARQPMQFIVL